MRIRFLGTHNSESKNTRLVSFIINDVLTVDAGSLVSELTFTEQKQIKTILLSHGHYDHIRAVPAFAVASWSDHGLHTRGTLEAFKRIASEDKWLMVHGRKKWWHFYQPENVEKQRQFFERFLKGADNHVKDWPKVTLEIREKYCIGDYRTENEWPLGRTEYTRLFLNASDGDMSYSPFQNEALVCYKVNDITDKTQNAKFEFKFNEKTELTGYMKLRLWVQADGNYDMDLFVAIEKIDRTGYLVPFPFFSKHDDGPVALGWLRVSHRELDEERSTPYQPVHKHQRQIKLEAGEIVPVEIEIWPSSTLFERGERLKVVVQGSDIYSYPVLTNGHWDVPSILDFS